MLAGIARGDTFQLADGSTLNGDIVTANEASLKIKIAEDLLEVLGTARPN